MSVKINTQARQFLMDMAKGTKIKGVSVEVGIFSGAHAGPRKSSRVFIGSSKGKLRIKQGTTLRPPTTAELGLWLHEGIPHNDTPPRPFLSSKLRGDNPRVKEFTAKLMKAITLAKLSPEQAAKFMGEWGRAEVVAGINNREYAPNAESTIAAKGSDTPLVDTAELRGEISYQVIPKEPK